MHAKCAFERTPHNGSHIPSLVFLDDGSDGEKEVEF